jgi:hypothetical protein
MPKDKQLPETIEILERAVNALGDADLPDVDHSVAAIAEVFDLFMDVCPSLQDHDEFSDVFTWMFARILPQELTLDESPENENLVEEHLSTHLADAANRSALAGDLRKLLKIAKTWPL